MTPIRAVLHAFLLLLFTVLSSASAWADVAGWSKENHLGRNGLTGSEYIQTASLIGGTVGFFFSGGEGVNVSLGSTVAASGLRNNYLSHGEALEREIAKRELAACLETGECSDEEISGLSSTIKTLDFVDAERDSFLRENCKSDPRGASCIAAIRELAYTLELFQNPQDPFGIGTVSDQFVLNFINAQILNQNGIFVEGSNGALTLVGMVGEWNEGFALLGEFSESWIAVQDERFTENALDLLAETMNILEIGGVAVLTRGGPIIRPAPSSRGSGTTFNPTKLADHFNRHGPDFGATSATQYQRIADNFLTGPRSSGVLERTRPNGDVVRFDPATDSFGVVSGGGIIRTFYKPAPRSPTNLGGYDPSKYSSALEYFNNVP